MKTLQALTRGRGEIAGFSLRSGEDREPSVSEEDSLDGLAVSEEEYWDRYYNYCEGNCDRSYEWNSGYLEEKPVGDVKSGKMYQWFLEILRCYLAEYPLGTLVNLDLGFRLAVPHNTSIRKPDMAVVLNTNPAEIGDNDASYSGIYDVCIEFLSYSSKRDIVRDTVQKKGEYAGAGVTEYYILDARGKETAFYRLNRKGNYSKIKPAKGEIVQSAVLPGFQFQISDLYTHPSLEKLSQNPVYQEYVLPFYQKARQEAESQKLMAQTEKQRAEQERLRAEAEKQRAEQEKVQAEAERLRAEQEKQRADQSEKRFFEAARTMLANGLELERIMKYTGLSAEELGKLSEAVL